MSERLTEKERAKWMQSAEWALEDNPGNWTAEALTRALRELGELGAECGALGERTRDAEHLAGCWKVLVEAGPLSDLAAVENLKLVAIKRAERAEDERDEARQLATEYKHALEGNTYTEPLRPLPWETS